VNLVSEPLKRQVPFKMEESLMAAAYAISQKSSCMKRKVGAVLVDEFGNIISSGYNEVPFYENSCESEFKSCFREKTREEYFAFLDSELEDTSLKGKLKEKFKETFKILDYCRALHAEENTIVNLARNGCSVSLEKSTLYSTTYPCRMCANKIVQANIKRIVYLEPYPDKKGKVILEQAGVKAEAFEGATFKAYFRVYGEQR
jgi:deoxycytidylate deaminase